MKFPPANDTLRTALVTGACSGIGLAIARRLASLGFDLVLVSEREEPLRRVAAEFAHSFAVRTDAITLDLARPDSAESLHRRVLERGHRIDILVSNAGFFFFGEIADADVARAHAMLQLHVVTPSLLCTLFGRDMRARRSGHVLIVSSISAWRDFPGIAYYGASKKYLRGFAASFRSEMSIYGVNVTTLAPGATATGLYDSSVVPVELAKRLGVMVAAESVADAGLAAMFSREAECMPGLLTQVMTAAAVMTPQRVIDLIRRRAPWLPRR